MVNNKFKYGLLAFATAAFIAFMLVYKYNTTNGVDGCRRRRLMENGNDEDCNKKRKAEEMSVGVTLEEENVLNDQDVVARVDGEASIPFAVHATALVPVHGEEAAQVNGTAFKENAFGRVTQVERSS